MARKFNLKINRVAAATALALSTNLYTNSVFADSPYPNVPLIWQSGVVKIKPNILLFLDTSGSMSERNGSSTRLGVAQSVIKDVIRDTREDNRWGLATFIRSNVRGNIHTRDIWGGSNTWINLGARGWQSAGGQILRNIDDVGSDSAAGRTNFNTLNSTINGLTANTNTPIPSSYYELIRYYRGMEPGFLNLRGPDNATVYTSPIQYRCQKNYIIYISDGEPTGYANRYQMGTLYHHDALMNSLRSSIENQATTVRGVADEIAGFAFNKDLIVGGVDKEGKSFDDPKFKNQTITTFTIGFTANIPLLNNMARQGGGQYFTANNSDALKSALLQSLNGIQQDAGYTPAALSVSMDGIGDIKAAISTTLNPSTWTSELRFYPFNPNTGSLDLTNYRVPKYKNTNTLTSSALFSTANGVVSVSQNNVPNTFNNTLFGISASRPDVPTADNLIIPITKSTNSNEYRSLLSWLLRWNASDVTSGTNYRDRNRNNPDSLARYMGDVSGNAVQLGAVKVAAANATDFDRKEYLAVPSNDGMLHILQANTGSDRGTYPYIETLQYIPGTAERDTATDTIMRNLVFTAEATYGDLRNPKQNFLAGELLNYTTAEGEITLVNGLGTGARGAYALMVGGKDQANNAVGLNVSRANWAQSIPMWDTSSSRFGGANVIYNRIGYNMGLPKVGYVSTSSVTRSWDGDVRAGVFLTSGFDDPKQQTPSLYILDHMAKNYANRQGFANTGSKGQLIRQIPIGRNYSVSTTAQTSVADIIQAHDGLTSAQGIDIDRDGLIDLAYAGDYKGNIWRFDLRSNSPSDWAARMIFKGNGSQPLVSEPNLMYWSDGTVGVYFGTGSNLYQGDLTANAQQSIYGIFDHVNKCAVSAIDSGICAPATRTDLIEQTIKSEVIGGATSYYIDSNNTYSNADEKRGFYLDLPSLEFRVVTTPEVISVGKRTAAGVIWNFEKIEGGSNSSGATETCTPESTSSSGFRFIADAQTGAESQYIKWSGAATESATGKLIVSLPYAGSSSKNIFITSNDKAMTDRGTMVSGIATKTPPEVDPCDTAGYIGSTTTLGGASLDKIECINPKKFTGMKRISWREIF